MSRAYYQLSTGRVAAIEGDCEFPPLEAALHEPNGLLAIGGDLSPARLLAAYRRGIFPWFSEGEPICWYSPDPRMVLFPDELKIAVSLKKILNKQPFELRMNTAFQTIIRACSNTKRPGQNSTWITPQMIDAYCELHAIGNAICSECWLGDELVGGCYGVQINNMFYGESMFHTRPNASKIAFVNLVENLKNHGVGMIDCQMKTPLLASFGAKEISRKEFAVRLAKLID